MNTVIAEMEFRILHDLFCENYGIQRMAFSFDEYVRLVFEKFVLSIIQMHILGWVEFVLLMLLTMGGSAMGESLMHCIEGDLVCVQFRSAKVFVLFGKFLYSFCE
jgi:hypothetical protein